MEKFTSIFDFTIIRELRKVHGFTIAELSEKSGVSTAVISKLERNQTRVELETLYRIGKVFGISPSELIKLAEHKTSQVVEEDSYESDGFSFRKVSFGNIKCMVGEAMSGKGVSRPDVHADEYEICWCLKGKVKISLPSEVHVLEKGKSMQFDAVLEHTYEALANCKILIIHVAKSNRF
ncbi:MAG: helix-turn-helix domain-containing protein [Kiritimatiellae bacterium]|nr:helix-turn-helix domain-containing protein [Kiritimatiellia bacterium]